LAKSAFPKLIGDLLRPTVSEYDRKVRTAMGRIFALAFLAALVVIGIGIMGLRMLPVLTCRHVEFKQVDCLLQERIAWLIPVHKTRVTDLQGAYVHTETGVVKDERGNPSTAYYDQVILVTRSGEIGLQRVESPGSLARLTSARLNAYLATHSDAPYSDAPYSDAPYSDTWLTVWGYGLWEHTLASMAGGIFVVLFGFLLVAAILNSSLLVAGWIVDFVLVVAGWGAGTLGCDPQVRDRVLRLRRVVEEIVTRPND
jgi:hypothetical protein